MNCRHCKNSLKYTFLDLGSAPPSNNYLSPKNLKDPELWLPLRVMVCDLCCLVQTEDFSAAENLFTAEYAYFSSFSRTWLDHARSYVTTMVDRFSLDSKSRVIEIAANDGYLLQYVRQAGIPCLGIEPTAGTAMVAREKGLDIIEEFFGSKLAEKLVGLGQGADLITASTLRLNYSFSYLDSLIVASALNNKCAILYSEDMQDGLQVHNKLKIINPLQQ